VQRLAQQNKLACGVAMLDDEEIVYVAYSPAVYVRNLQRSIGSRQVAFATAIGRILLAHQTPAEIARFLKRMRAPQLTPLTETDPDRIGAILSEVRESHYALVSQQTEIGLHAIGVPIFDRSGRVLAAMSLSSRDPWMQDSDTMRATLADLHAASAEITEGLAA
jgi:IclR family pca regulon transcriptional regulator